MIKKPILLGVMLVALQGCSSETDLVKYYAENKEERAMVLKKCNDSEFFKFFNDGKCKSARIAAEVSFFHTEDPTKDKTYKTFKGGSGK